MANRVPGPGQRPSLHGRVTECAMLVRIGRGHPPGRESVISSAGRGRGREDGPARVPDCVGAGAVGGTSGRSGVGDGTRVLQPASAVLDDARSTGETARSTAAQTGGHVRLDRRRSPRPVSRRIGHAEPVVGGDRGASRCCASWTTGPRRRGTHSGARGGPCGRGGFFIAARSSASGAHGSAPNWRARTGLRRVVAA